MLIVRAYRYELDPNNKQRTHLYQHAGTARFAYNWGLEQRIRLYQTRTNGEQYTTNFTQQKILNTLKKSHFPWMYEVSKCAPQEALRDLERAFKNYFRRLKQGKTHHGFPRFKKKGVHDRFRLTGTIKFVDRQIQLPRLGRIRLKEMRSYYYRGRILSATISRKVDRWFVAVTVEEEIEIPMNHGPHVGVDLGVKTIAVTSKGKHFSNPRAINRHRRKVQRLSHLLSKKKRGSKNRAKARLHLTKIYFRISNIRKDALHKLTTCLAKNHGQIVIEDLNVSDMMKNHRLLVPSMM